MPFDSEAIANYFLKLARDRDSPLTPMKLQKLAYYAHGWHLAIRRAPLIAEQVEAWSFGPVIPSLYHAFKHHGDRPIDEPASLLATWVDPEAEMPGIDDFELRYVEPSVDDWPEEASSVKPLLDRVWEVYGKFSAVQLSNMTHESGSPWHQIYSKYGGQIPRGTDIPAETIRDYFAGLARPKAAG